MEAYTEDIRLAPESEPVCHCAKVSKADILKAIKDGAKTLSDIKEMTGACKKARCRQMSPRKR